MNASLTQNYFELFGLPVAFQVDASALAIRYRELQRETHPDRFANSSDRDRRIAMQQASLVNEAYQTLRSPLLRGRYMIGLQGISFDDDKDTTVDPDFLMEQMEWREALATIRDTTDSLDKLNALIKNITARNTQLELQLADTLGHAQWLPAKSLVHKLQFLSKLRQEAEAIEGELLESQ